jgi:phosphoglycerate dehydrogenase-like enzyme
MIALTHHVRIKDMVVRDGQWDQRSRYMGRKLRDRTFGAIGLGGIARKTIAFLKGFGMKSLRSHATHFHARCASRPSFSPSP